MCGIVGTINFQDGTPVDQIVLRQMLGAIRHRGPDQFGLYTFSGSDCTVGLGNARLSIIDLGGGQQPISNENGSIWIVFNGEIFNYIELRPQLQRQGHRFATDSDTEIIVHLYEQYGPDCVQHLNDQFAFAIWDERTQVLFIARDRLGIRPLYYTVQDNTLIFASEIKALLADPKVPAELDLITLDQIFTYWSPLSPRSAFRDIQMLPPGYWLQINAWGERRLQQYWTVDFSEKRCTTLASERECTQELRSLLIDTTQIRLRADVPVGAYLSDGSTTAYLRTPPLGLAPANGS